MKKILLVIAAISILVFAGSALAGSGGRRGQGHGFGGPRLERSFDVGPGGFGGDGPDNIDIPQEIIDKRETARGLMTELRSELSKNPIDKARALDLYKQHRAIRNDIDEWFFLRRLEYISQGTPLPR